MSVSRSFVAASALAALAAASASAQPRVNPLPPADAAPPPAGENVLVGYIQKAYGVSRREAEERVQIQGEIAALLENPAFSRDENFAGVVVENEPVYQVFLLYDDNDAKSELLKLVPPTLRKYVKIRKTRFSKRGRQNGEQEIQRALKAANVKAVVDYDQRGDVFLIQAPGADAARIRGLLPTEYQDAFRLDTSAFPAPEQYTTGTAGRSAYAGYVLNPGCTLAFAVTYTYGGVAGRQGILSAGHCFEPSDPDKSLDWADGGKTVFVNPVWRLSQNSIDVAFLDTTGMTTGYWINYDNPARSTGGYANQVGGFATPQGWLRAKNFIRASASWVGMSVCKQGRMTALTCGEVTSTSYPYTYFGDGRYVRVSNSKQQELSAPGDSGGPWFTSTVVSTSTDVSVLGVHITGAGTGTTAYALYMPIDRVFALPAGGPTDVRLFLTP